ncbi:MAG: hypothetical protein KatS3mg029_0149 [Saprospiraceae bacterium]|nr:MAG: hypothetical protein KatS3mg029_0149 [Saprospiraceae bacterium]
MEHTNRHSPGAEKLGKPLVFFIVNRLYEWSQNFITRELSELNELGLEMLIGARQIIDRPDLAEAEKRLREKYFPIADNPFNFRYLKNHLALAFRRPRRYLQAWKTLFSLRHELKKFPRAVVCLFRAAGIAAEIERRGVTLIHAHFLTAPAETALYLSVFTGIPFSATAYAMDLYVDTSGLKGKLARAAAVNGTTLYNERFMDSLLTGHPKKTTTRYYGLPPSKTIQPAPPAAPFTFLAVGRMVEKKGFEYLLLACHILKKRGLQFRCEIIGTGPLEAKLRNMVAELGLANEVHIQGMVLPNHLDERYRNSHVLVAPCVVASNGDIDGLPNVILEAMNNGLPVISTDISGIPEAVVNGYNGWLVPQKNVQALAHAMEQAIHLKNLEAMRQAARQTISEKFDIAKNAQKIKDWLEGVARHAGVPQRQIVEKEAMSS